MRTLPAYPWIAAIRLSASARRLLIAPTALWRARSACSWSLWGAPHAVQCTLGVRSLVQVRGDLPFEGAQDDGIACGVQQLAAAVQRRLQNGVHGAPHPAQQRLVPRGDLAHGDVVPASRRGR